MVRFWETVRVTDLTWLWILLGVVVVIGVGSALLVPRSRRRRADHDAQGATTVAPPAEPAAPPAESAPAAEPEGAAPEEAAPAPPALETPEPVAGRLVRLRDRLARSGSPFGARLLSVLSRDHLTEDDWDELEETLLLADIGAGPAEELLEALRTRVRVLGVRDPKSVRELLREELLKVVDPALDREVATTGPVGEDGERLDRKSVV